MATLTPFPSPLPADTDALKALIEERVAAMADHEDKRDQQNKVIAKLKVELETLQNEAQYLLQIKPRPVDRDPKSAALI